MGPWPKNSDLKQAGALFVIAAESSYHAYGLTLLTRGLGWSAEEARALCDAAYAAHLDRKSKVHAYNHLYVSILHSLSTPDVVVVDALLI